MKEIILGTGPCGIGAAYRALDLGCPDFKAFERQLYVGGLSGSFIDPAGFTWDIGGHVLFSHYDYFDKAVAEALGGAYYEHMRECWVRLLDTWVPYPFQNNIRHLPPKARERCIAGLKNLIGDPSCAANFREWMDAVFGEGIVHYFMAPYNFKVWATPPELMGKDWIAERVSVVDLARIERNMAECRDEVAWGPNNLFRFPKRGGTGAIYKAVAEQFQNRICLEHDLTGINFAAKQLRFGNGFACSYDRLITTLPIDKLISMSDDAPAKVREAAGRLLHNSVYVVGIGVRGQRDDSRCWMYFPEDDCPFYRVTNFHNYSPCNVPDDGCGPYRALMCETSYSAYKPVAKEAVIEETIQGLIHVGLLTSEESEHIVSRHLMDVPYAYPIPTIGRDSALRVIQDFLESVDVYSRGRFGAWKYEIGNMDHSFMQGVEIVNRLVTGEKETVLF
jgi:protoporphyrinogen oxidase